MLEPILTQATDSMLKDGFGATLIANKLSPYCLGRPVSQGTDVGIDIFCETVDKETVEGKGYPHLHFWLQVKYDGGFLDKKTMSYPFKVRHLNYWKKQPVPVFAVIIASKKEWPHAASDSEIYWCNISSYLLFNDVDESKTGKDPTQSISGQYWNRLDDAEGFVRDIIPHAVAELSIAQGFFAAIPQGVMSSYVQNSLVLDTDRHQKIILRQLERTTALTVLSNRSLSIDRSEFSKLKRILEAFKDDRHYETFLALARIANEEGDDLEFYENVREAEKCVEEDDDLSDEKRDELRGVINGVKDRKSRRSSIISCIGQGFMATTTSA